MISFSDIRGNLPDCKSNNSVLLKPVVSHLKYLQSECVKCECGLLMCGWIKCKICAKTRLFNVSCELVDMIKI